MDELTSQHPANPEVWGRRAQLLYENDRVDEAEGSLEKALEINPKYPFGHLLRGLFRKYEGELAGALLMFRKAAELYDPDVKDTLAQVYSLIGECEMHLRRPLAVHAAFQMAYRLHPNDELRDAIDKTFGKESALPASASRNYALIPTPASAAAGVQSSWQQAVAQATSGKLAAAAKAFEQVTHDMPAERTAWYNLGLTRAWLGENAPALEALDRYVALEADEIAAAAAWALAEVLRFGQGMEDHADYVEHSAVFQIRDPDGFFRFLDTWQKEGLLYGVQADEQGGLLTGIVLDRGGLIAGGPGMAQFPKLGAYFVAVAGMLRFWGVSTASLDRVRQDAQLQAGASLSEPQAKRGPASFHDVLAEALVFPVGTTDKALIQQKIREQVEFYFEEKWSQRPLHSLDHMAPTNAASQSPLRKKLRGVVQFLEECVARTETGYNFDGLRKKLGLAGETAPAVSSTDGPAKLNIEAMGAAELGALELGSLSDEQIDQAYRMAQKLDAHDLASRFAKTLVARPARPEHPDRFAWYTFLIQRALVEGDTDAALQYVDEGEKSDCEQNQGRRRNDYELRRGQVLSKRREVDSARDVFERLIERAPSELRYRGTAAESMLSMKQASVALRFAEQGLAKAREQNDRDSERYFLELVAAARKQAG